MKKLLFLAFILTLSSFGIAVGQVGIVKGTVLDAESGTGIPGVTVGLVGSNQSVFTDASGKFELPNVSVGDQSLQLTLVGYEDMLLTLNIKEGDNDLGTLNFKRSVGNDAQSAVLSEAMVSADEIDGEVSSQNVSSLLQSSSDVFNNIAGFTFGAARFRIRGYDSDYSDQYMNGISVNDPESGYGAWSQWAGLNDVTRGQVNKIGLQPGRFSFGNLGGITNIDTRASSYRTGFKASYAHSNRSYTDRVMATYSTGVLSNGWAFTVSGSRRYAKEGYTQGTSYDAWAYFMAIEKKISDNHSVALTAFGAPVKRGMANGSIQEAYDLVGSNYYNSNWGWQDGSKRNAKIRNTHEPMIILNDYFKINEKTQLTTSLGYTFGRNGTTALNWYDAPDPRPDYYRYLPSYNVGSSDYQDIVNSFMYNSSVNQINWDALYNVNYGFDTTIQDANGITGNNVAGHMSKYFVEERRDDQTQFTASSNITTEINSNITLTGGVEIIRYHGKHFKTINDLLGGDFVLDVDQFAERDFTGNPIVAQNNLAITNHIVKVGDIYGYNYESNVNTAKAWTLAEFSYSKFDYYLAASYTYTNFYRTGKMQNGRFPTNSLGKSAVKEFNNFGFKGGATYKMNGRNYFELNLAYITRAPFFKDSYISPRVNNKTANHLKSESVQSFDLSYNLRTPFVKARFTVYTTQFKDQAKLSSFYTDTYRTFVNYATTGIDTRNSGLEIGAEMKLSPTITATTALGLGIYQYTSRPLVTISTDNSDMLLALDETVYCKGFYVAGTPQTAASVGLKYSSPKYWFAGFNVNYFADNYLSFNTDRRTSYALTGVDNEVLYHQIVDQEKLPDAYTVDLYGGYSYKFGKNYLNFSFNVSNVLDKTNFKTGGYEQMRFDVGNDVSKFPPKYFYGYGRTFFVMLSYRF